MYVSLQKEIMANQLVPYIQDEEKWIKHYTAQAQKQIKRKEMMKLVKEKPVQPSIVLPTMQLVAQAESELKHQQNEAPVFTPTKATPKFESTHSLSVTDKGEQQQKGRVKQRNNPKRRKPQRTRKGHQHI